MCEIHPCNYRGALTMIYADGSVLCACEMEFTGAACDVSCRANGDYNAVGRCRFTPGSPQVDRAWVQRLKLKYDEVLSNLAFNFKLSPCNAASGECECYPGWTGRLCDIPCPGCGQDSHGACTLSAPSERSWVASGNTGEYTYIETVCVCEEFWLGGNCTVPCPCARGGFARGACGIDPAALAAGAPDEELGTCNCEEGFTADDCTIPCPVCVYTNGDCVPPAGTEAGIGEQLNFIQIDPTLVGPGRNCPATSMARHI